LARRVLKKSAGGAEAFVVTWSPDIEGRKLLSNLSTVCSVFFFEGDDFLKRILR